MTVSDTLETVFKLTGAQAGIAQFGALATGATTLAAAETAATAATEALSVALASLGGPVGVVIAAAVAALLAVLAAAPKAVSAFAEAQDTLFRTSILFKNLGTSLPIDQLEEMAGAIQDVTGIDDDELIKTAGLLARFGVAGEQIPDALKAITNASAGTGKSMEELANAFGRATQGQERGLKGLVTGFKSTGDAAKDATQLIDLFNQSFTGAAEARRDTLAGTLDAFTASTGRLLEALGRLLEPVILPTLNALIAIMDSVSRILNGVSDFFGIAQLPSGGTGDTAAALKIKGGGKDTELLGEIARNTRTTADRLIEAVLGGPGTVANRAATLRDARIAFGV